MKQLILAGLLLFLTPALGAHGGNYSGPGGAPGDTVPANPGPSSSTPGRVVPQSGDQSGTTAPVGGDARTGTGTTGQQSTSAAASAMSLEDDLTSWRYWWYYNSKPYLDLKRSVHARAVVPGSDDFFLGARQHGGLVGGVRPDAELVHGTIVPRLIEALETEPSQQVLTSALLALCRLKGDAAYVQKAEAAISPLLANPDGIVVEVAAISLGILGSDRSATTLAALLADDTEGRKLHGGRSIDARVQAFAAYGLGQIGMRTERVQVRRYIATKLQAEFESAGRSDFDVRVACVLSIGAFALEPDDDYQPSEDVRLDASACLQAQVAWVLGVLDDEQLHPIIRAHAPTTLGRILAGAERAGLSDLKARVASALLELLAPDSDAPLLVSQSAALALGQLGDADDDELDREIRATLEHTATRASDQATRNFALISLAQVSGRPGTDGAIPAAARTRKTLVAAIERGATMQRPWAALAIGVLERSLSDAHEISSSEMAAFLRATLAKTRSPELTSATAIALGILRDEAAEETLLEVLNRTGDTGVRGYSMISLGLIRARGSLPQIENILRESRYRPELVETAAVSLALMHDPELVPRLIEMLHANSSVPAQGAICFSLGNVGDVRAAQALIEMSNSPELGAVARGLAIEALGLVAERFELPWNTELSANTNYLANPTSLSNPHIVGVLDLF